MLEGYIHALTAPVSVSIAGAPPQTLPTPHACCSQKRECATQWFSAGLSSKGHSRNTRLPHFRAAYLWLLLASLSASMSSASCVANCSMSAQLALDPTDEDESNANATSMSEVHSICSGTAMAVAPYTAVTTSTTGATPAARSSSRRWYLPIRALPVGCPVTESQQRARGAL